MIEKPFFSCSDIIYLDNLSKDFFAVWLPQQVLLKQM